MTLENKVLQIRCSGCQAVLKVKPEVLGRTVACPKCDKKMKLVKPSKSPAPAAAPHEVPAPALDLANLPPAYLNVNPTQSSYPQAIQPSAHYQNRTVAKKSSIPWLWVGIAGVAVSIFLVVGIASVAWVVLNFRATGPALVAGSLSSSLPTSSALSGSSSTAVGAPTIDFPQLGEPQSFGNKNIVWHRVLLPRPDKLPLKLNIFVPKGNHAERSLPVMFEAPAGTPLLHGASIEVPHPSTEYLPFTEAGMITVTYDIDGEMPGNVSPAAGIRFMNHLSMAYSLFVDADAGVDNGKMAIDFVLARLPVADPDRLMTWGHSSAATLSLLLASKDFRISKCIAMAPITDLRPRLGEILQEPTMARVLPNFESYLVSGSPITHVQQLRCPVFIAHARNDDNAPFEVTKTYVDSIRRAGGDVRFLELEREGHYKPLLDAGIPKALEWLN
jgi:hypothetical protein